MSLHASIPASTPGGPRRGVTVACPDHPQGPVQTHTHEALNGDRDELVTRVSWTCSTCRARLTVTPETTP